MTFVRKFNGKAANSNQEPMVAVYRCPEHGEFDCEVRRDENGEAPDEIECPYGLTPETWCDLKCTWTPSSSVGCRVRRVEVTRGKWESPERRTYLDTRKLGEGQSMDEFKAERRKVWDERRRQTVKELLR